MLQTLNKPASKIKTLENAGNRGFLGAVVALIAVLDGANAQLFHVEHWSNGEWEYQTRWPESAHASLREWKSPSRCVNADSSVFSLIDPTVPVEARWRPVRPKNEEEAWQRAVPHEFGKATARFLVRVRAFRDFSADPIVRASAIVRDHPTTFDLIMPRRQVAIAGEEVLEVQGEAWGRVYGNLLRVPGEFSSRNEVFEISNSSASQAALLTVPVARPGKNEFLGASFVKVGRLSPEEITKLMEDYSNA